MTYAYAICYGKSLSGAACRNTHCSNAHSPGRVTLGQLRWDSIADERAFSCHLQCVRKGPAANYVKVFKDENDGDYSLEDAVDAFPGLDQLRDEHKELATECLKTILSGGALDDDQIKWLESVYDEAKTKVSKKKSVAKTKLGRKAKDTTQKAKGTTAEKRKTPEKKSTPTAKKKTKAKKKKTKQEDDEHEQDVEEEHIAGDAEAMTDSGEQAEAEAAA